MLWWLYSQDSVCRERLALSAAVLSGARAIYWEIAFVQRYSLSKLLVGGGALEAGGARRGARDCGISKPFDDSSDCLVSPAAHKCVELLRTSPPPAWYSTVRFRGMGTGISEASKRVPIRTSCLYRVIGTRDHDLHLTSSRGSAAAESGRGLRGEVYTLARPPGGK